MLTSDRSFECVLEPVSGERQWFKILPSVLSFGHFAEHAGEKAATFIAECFRAHLEDRGEGFTNDQIFDFALRFIRNGEIEAFVRLHEGNPQARFSFPSIATETVQ